MQYPLSYIIIDDDAIHNKICTLGIQKYHPAAAVASFTDPLLGLEYLKTEFQPTREQYSILLLDLNMPLMNGWEFMEELNSRTDILSQLDVYILTSSVDKRDRDKAWTDPRICGFMEKPLTAYQLDSMAFVKELKNSFSNQLSKSYTYRIPSQERELLDLILPEFQLNEVINVQKCIRALQNGSQPQLRNLPTNTYADNIKTFLIANDFAYNLCGDPLINKKGINLKLAGSLYEFEKIELERNRQGNVG